VAPIRRTFIRAKGWNAERAFGLAQSARKFESRVTLLCSDDTVNAKEPAEVLTLGPTPGQEVVLEVEGKDEQEAFAALLPELALAAGPYESSAARFQRLIDLFGAEATEYPRMGPTHERRELTRIGVFGVGGAGCNAISHMIDSGLAGVEMHAVNTDSQALGMSLSPKKIQIGVQLTGGLGSGGDPNIGKQAADESIELLREALSGFDMVFVAAGEGGGTGTGAAPVVAEVAKRSGALVVAVVTKPFRFEGKLREQRATNGVEALRPHADTVIVVPNERVLAEYDQKPCFEAFRLADEMLLNAVRGISEMITTRQLINIDFADVRAVMSERGGAVMSVGIASGPGRASEAANRALKSPLIEDVMIESARKILLHISGDDSMTLKEVDEAATTVFHATKGQADVRMGAARNKDLHDNMKVTMFATGLTEPLPKVDEVSDLLAKMELFPAGKRRVGAEGALTIDRNNLDIPTFIRRQIDGEPSNDTPGRPSSKPEAGTEPGKGTSEGPHQ
jgi:cell division protein FtsZ